MKINYRLFCKEKLNLQLDKWQEEVINHTGDIVIAAGRQTGKSTGISLKAYFYGVENSSKTILVVASAQRQAELLFDKIKTLFVDLSPELIKEEPTQTKLILNNGTKIYCIPAGRTGYAIRGYTIDLLIADEAPYIAEAVWVALTPMLAVTGGSTILLGTPFGKGGYFYNRCHDSDWKFIHRSSENCPRIPKSFLEKEKKDMTTMQYAQEYLAEFTESFNQFFPTQLIKKCCSIANWNFKENFAQEKRYYLGLDIARYGGDENAFVISELQNNNKMRIVKVQTTSNISTTDTIGRTIELNKMFNFSKVFIDDGGIGGAVVDILIEKLGRKVVGINNSSRSIDKEGKRKLKILKEDLYSNLLVMMEQGKVEMLDLPELKKSLACMTFKYTTEKNLMISGNYSHIAEAAVRSVWGIKQKGLNIYIY